MSHAALEFRQQALTHLDALYNFALYLTRRPPDAEDLVQETYLRAFRFAHRFEPGTHLRAWLFQILRNTFLTFYRRESRELAVLDKEVGDGPDDAWEVDGAVFAAATVVDLERALGELGEDFRSVILLADLEGFPLAEIARMMDTPIGTVKSRLFRARRLLRRRLADYRSG
ncbi:MAG: sigma-70 family RNA polymerase sigma factor [Candidatus Rokuibacteriota bacterium]